MNTITISFFRFIGWVLLFFTSMNITQAIMMLVYRGGNYESIVIILVFLISLSVLLFVKNVPSDNNAAVPKRSVLPILLTILFGIITILMISIGAGGGF